MPRNISLEDNRNPFNVKKDTNVKIIPIIKVSELIR
jgi:hypothetical protein